MIVKNYVTTYWNDLLAQNASDLDRARLLAWIQEESAGFPQALGAVYEVGIFQLDLQDGPAYGGTLETLHANFCESASSQKRVRDLTDDEELLQVTSGVAYVRHCLSAAQSQLDSAGVSWNDDDLWCHVKLQHGLPGLAKLVSHAAVDGGASSWSDFRNYVLALGQDGVANYDANTSRYWSKFPSIFDNAEKVGYADGAGLISGSGSLSTLGTALVSIAILLGVLYYGGRHGLPV